MAFDISKSGDIFKNIGFSVISFDFLKRSLIKDSFCKVLIYLVFGDDIFIVI